MTDFDPAAAVAAYHAEIAALDFEALERRFAPDAVYLSAGTGDTIGRAQVLAAFRRYFTDYPDQVAHDDSIVQTGPMQAVAHWRLTATHAKTGAPLKRQGTECVTFDEQGRILRVEVREG